MVIRRNKVLKFKNLIGFRKHIHKFFFKKKLKKINNFRFFTKLNKKVLLKRIRLLLKNKKKLKKQLFWFKKLLKDNKIYFFLSNKQLKYKLLNKANIVHIRKNNSEDTHSVYNNIYNRIHKSKNNSKNHRIYRNGFYKREHHSFYKKKHNRFSFFFSKQKKRVINSIVYKRFKILRRLRGIPKTNLYVFLRYPALRWFLDKNLVYGYRRYKRNIDLAESRGLKRKQKRRRLSNYSLFLFDKQKLAFFYGRLTDFKIKSLIKIVLTLRLNNLNVFVSLLESQFFSVIVRSGFSLPTFNLKKMIKMGFFLINGKPQLKPEFILCPGDIISINPMKSMSLDFLFQWKRKLSFMFFPSKYIDISLLLKKIYLYRRPKITEVPFFFNINLMRILLFYKTKGL